MSAHRGLDCNRAPSPMARACSCPGPACIRRQPNVRLLPGDCSAASPSVPALIGIDVLKKNSDETSFFVKTDARLARKRPTVKDVLSRQHGSGKAAVPVEVQCQTQIFAAGARNPIDVEITCQVETTDSLVGVEPHQCPARTRQAIDLLIRAQFHIVETSILAAPVVSETGVRGEPPRAENPFTS